MLPTKAIEPTNKLPFEMRAVLKDIVLRQPSGRPQFLSLGQRECCLLQRIVCHCQHLGVGSSRSPLPFHVDDGTVATAAAEGGKEKPGIAGHRAALNAAKVKTAENDFGQILEDNDHSGLGSHERQDVLTYIEDRLRSIHL